MSANNTQPASTLIERGDLILVTGASGFLGARVVESLVRRGSRNIRCFTRPSSNRSRLAALLEQAPPEARIQILEGNLLNRDDCARAVAGVKLVYHLAAGRGQKMFADAFLNSVVTTRNLLDACVSEGGLQRFVNISSFAVYDNSGAARGEVLDESRPVERFPHRRGDAYTFAKVKQDELVMRYHRQSGIPCVIVRPGVVYGPGNEGIHGRIGIGTFGVFLHLGGSNPIPLTYVDNCADAVVLAGLQPGVEGEVFNVVDDDLPTSRRFLRTYKRQVKPFFSLYVPKSFSFLLSWLWEKYSEWSVGQLPPVYNRSDWNASWKKARYSNRKLKKLLGWQPLIPTSEALRRHFESCRNKLDHHV